MKTVAGIERSGKNWRNPGFKQSAKEPVVCLSWNDTQRYIKWLSEKTGERYRLPSEAEWEYAARAGSETKYFFGNSTSDLCRSANGAAAETDFSWRNKDCRDGYKRTAPAASFTANAFGLYDMHGNVREWTQDCWNDSYKGAPSDGSAWLSGECGRRVLRGGSWLSNPTFLRSANRYRFTTDNRNNYSVFASPELSIKSCIFTSLNLVGAWGLCPQRKFFLPGGATVSVAV